MYKSRRAELKGGVFQSAEQEVFATDRNDIMSDNDKFVMAQTIWGEARGESSLGQEAVAWVIKNRRDDGR